MLSFYEAREKVLGKVERLGSEEVRTDELCGRILSQDVKAPISLPPFDNSMMDGYAVKSAEVRKCLSAEVSQIVRAGDEPVPLKNGTCAKIMTGAMMPAGADSVVQVEDATIDEGTVTFFKPVTKGQFIRFKGEDVEKGSIVAKKGTTITARHVALFSALGLKSIPVRKRPKIGILTTGSELQTAGERSRPGKIYDSCGPLLKAELSSMGLDSRLISCKDKATKISAGIKKLLSECDVLVTVGGVSVGEFDYVKSVLEKLGVKQEFWRVKMKPGKPLVFGTFKGKYIFGLPGNPVSVFVTFDQFVRPALLKMMGGCSILRERVSATLEKNITGSERFDLLRGIASRRDGGYKVRSAGGQNSAMLLSLAAANCLILVPEEKRLVKKGETVEIELL